MSGNVPPIAPPPGAPPGMMAPPLLPPGMTLGEFLHLQSQLETIAIVVAVVFGVVIWDYFIQLPREIALYTSSDRSLWRSPTTWCFIILRYSGIMATLPALWFTSLQSDNCNAAVITSQVGAVLAVASSGAIFCFRVFAIWMENHIVKKIIGVFYLFLVASYIAVATQYSAVTGPHTLLGSNCLPQPIKPWAVISNASSVAFDTAVLLVTLMKLRASEHTRQSALGQMMYKDSLFYFVLTTVTNIVVLVFYSIDKPSFALIKPAALPFSTLMTVTMGTRVYLNLKLYDRKPTGSQQASSQGSNSAQQRLVYQASQPRPFTPMQERGNRDLEIPKTTETTRTRSNLSLA